MKKDAFYFPHFSNARNDRKLRRIRKELGVEGYGIYYMILEVLREQYGYKYPLDDIDLLADEFGTSEQKIRTVIANYKLFEVDDNENFFSLKFIEYLTPYIEAKTRNRISGIKGNLIKHGYVKKQDLEGLTDAEIIELNNNKPLLSGGDSGGGRNKEKKRKEKEINITPIQSVTNTSKDERFLKFCSWVDCNLKSVSKIPKQINESDFNKLIDKYDTDLLAEKMMMLNSWLEDPNVKSSQKKKVSVYHLMINTWLKNNY